MSDLISRSEVNDVIDELEVYTSGRPNTMKVEISVLQLQRFINKLKNIPTAYDIDKVVADLNELDVKAIKRYKNGNFGDYEGTDYYIKKRKAIEIVKHGGVSDDACEWVIVDRPHNLPIYNTSCGKIRLQYVTGVDIYCNGCGKKIKVVE